MTAAARRLALYAGAGLLALGVALLAWWLVIGRSRAAETRAATARVAQARSESLAGAARDATTITGNTMDDIAAVDRQTEANHETIRSGDGSDAIALRALCLRRAYRDQPRCAALLKLGAGATR